MLNEEARRKILNLPANTNKRFEDIENLKEVSNISYVTDTGEYTIENSKKGYITNLNIQGKTLVNLWGNNISDFSLWKTTFSDNKINITTEDGVMYHNFFTTNYSVYKPNTLYTVIVNVYKNTLPETSGIYVHSIGEEKSIFGNPTTNCTINGGNIGKFKYSFTTLNDLSSCNIVLRSIINNETSTTGYEVSLNITILEGDYTNTNMDYFNGLQSVGQGDNIELFSCEEDINIIPNNITWKDGYFLNRNDNLEYESEHYSYTLDYIPVKADTSYTLIYANWNILLYDKYKNIINFGYPNPFISINGLGDKTSEGLFFIETPLNSCYMRISVPTRFKDRITISEGVKFDKKVIPYTLRSLPNGVKDEIVYKNNKYYLIKRCEEYTYTEIVGNLDLSYVYDKSLCYMGTLIPKALPSSNVLCNELKGKSGDDFNNNDEDGCAITNLGDIAFKILKSKLTTQDKDGFNEWIKNNPITIIYQLAEPKEIELTPLNLEQYNNQTKFICNSGIMIPNISFESTQNLGSHIETIRENIKNISNIQMNDETVDLAGKLLNGWVARSYLNPQEFGCIFNKIGRIVYVNMRVYSGLVDKNTVILKLPNILMPKHFVVFKVFDSAGSTLVGNMYIDIINGCIKIGEALSSNKDIIIMGHYYLD
ncbi:hypothetical protein ACTPDI_11020 [Clostridioides difficile]